MFRFSGLGFVGLGSLLAVRASCKDLEKVL